jgi:hypothetical protein
MILYYSIFSVISIFGLFVNKTKTFIYFSTVSFLFCMSFLRWECGTDWNSYYLYFKRSTSLIKSAQYEIGYSLMNFLIRSLTENYSIFLLVYASLFFFIKYTFIYKYSNFLLIGLLASFSMFAGDIFFVRMNFATCITLFSTKFIFKRNLFYFMICILLASLFHISALIFIISYFIYEKRFSTFKMLLLIILILLAATWIKSILLHLANMNNDNRLGQRAIVYLTRGFGGTQFFSNRIQIAKSVLNRSFLFLLSLLLLRKHKREDKIFNYYFNQSFLSVISIVALAPVSLDLSRIASYFTIYDIFLIQYFYGYFKERKIKYFGYALLCLYLFLRLNVYILGFRDSYIPYRSILFN